MILGISKVNPASNQRGMSIVSLALTLPIVLLLILASIQLFVYYRAVAAVERAAGEAARVLAASLLPESIDASTHQQSQVQDKKILSSVSGGDTMSSLALSFREHGQLYEPVSSSNPAAIKLPFELSSRKNGPDYVEKIPGVNYLPLVSVWTCLEPTNETSQSIGKCGPVDTPDLHSNFLTYQLPTKLDFDGDGREDITFFYANPDGPDWWILLSSAGTLFRNAIKVDQGAVNQTSPERITSLPCPADYDGDKKTDLCIAITKEKQIEVKIAFSSLNFVKHRSFYIDSIDAQVALPVPGRWTDEDRDSFAVVLLESSDTKNQLATYVWPTFLRTEKKLPSEIAYDLDDTPQRFNSRTDKPRPGRFWRPAFGDHDGDGVLDIGWLTWSGANPSIRIAGEGKGVETTNIESSALKTKLSPWKLFYPPGEKSPGLFVVETNNHRISLITKGDDDLIDGLDKNEQYRVVAGLLDGDFDQTTPTPNPIFLKQLGAKTTPTNEQDEGCPSCYSGGGYSAEKGAARQIALNTPKDVTALETGPLYVADYGNLRVRKIEPASGDTVTGTGNEIMTTIVGGSVPENINCPPLTDFATNVSTIERKAQDWTDYSNTSEAGIHPRCVAVRPLSLALNTRGSLLFIGDESGVVFALTPGLDGDFDSSPDERLYIVAGKYGEVTAKDFVRSQTLGLPIKLSFFNDARLGERLLVLVHRILNDLTSTEGEILQITPSGKKFTSLYNNELAASEIEEMLPLNLHNDSLAQAGYKLSANGTSIFNPTDFVVYQNTRQQSKHAGLFVNSWWQDETEGNFHNSLLHVAAQPAAKIQNDSSELRDLLPNPITLPLNNIHLNSWGKRASDATATDFIFENPKAHPLATMPVTPTTGIAISPDQRFLYFSQNSTGQIFAVELDTDGDGEQDLHDPTEQRTSDLDIDGDGIENDKDSWPYIAEQEIEVASVDTTLQTQLRPLDVYLDAVLWAKNPFGMIDAGGKPVDRLEWWLDRFAAPVSTQQASKEGPPPQESPPFIVLNSETIAALAPMSAIHSVPVWNGGFLNESELNPVGGVFRLAPIILGSKSPSLAEIKDVSGWNECDDWTLADSIENTLSSDGKPISDCSRDLSKAVYGDGRRVGTRRAHLAHWAGNWHPFSAEDKTDNELTFIDWDGDGKRNPAIVELDRLQLYERPLLMRIGNLTGLKPGSSGYICPGNFAVESLSQLTQILNSKYQPPLTTSEVQYDCNQAEIRFLTSAPAPFASVMLDTHAEWRTATVTNLVNYPKQSNTRFNTTAGSASSSGFETGPVAEAAYRTLESSLKVLRRHSDTVPFDANVAIDLESSVGGDNATIKVSYILPLNTVIARLRGQKQITISSETTRRVYGSSGVKE